MTREEAIAKVRGFFAPYEMNYRVPIGGAITIPDGTAEAARFIDASIALGLLKLEEPKTMEDEAKEYLESYGHGASYLLFLLQKGGFKIVRET